MLQALVIERGDEQVQAANNVLVDYLPQLQLTAHWGSGAFSSSDGQRSPARGRAATANAIAREFGYRRTGLTLINWVSDQYSQYGTKVVSVAEREAVHTLEAILHTQLPIAEHTTDTHGATELVFALFDLLGLRFIPRLKDAGDLRLHRLGQPTGLPVDAVLRSRARPERIRGHYDDLLRTAATLKRGRVPARLLITRLKNATPQSPLAAALATRTDRSDRARAHQLPRTLRPQPAASRQRPPQTATHQRGPRSQRPDAAARRQ